MFDLRYEDSVSEAERKKVRASPKRSAAFLRCFRGSV